MKERAATIIGGMLAVSFIVFTGMGKVPIDVFVPVASAAIIYFYKEGAITNLWHTITNLWHTIRGGKK